MRLKLIACEILLREFCAAIVRTVNHVDVEFMPKGLHDIGQEGMSKRLKEVVAEVDESQYDAIVMGYALCSNGLVGLTAGKIPLVIPRAHDCITLFLGDKDRYMEYFQAHPGVYYKTSGWIERGQGLKQLESEAIQETSGMTQSLDDMIKKYGEDNGKFLHEQLCNMTRNYCGFTYIEMGIEPDDRYERETRDAAAEQGWEFEKLQGDMGLIHGLLEGDWDEEKYLVVPPGHCVAPSFDDGIIKAEKVDS